MRIAVGCDEAGLPLMDVIREQLKSKGQTARIGEVIGYLDESATEPTSPSPSSSSTVQSPASAAAPATPPAPPAPRVMPAAERVLAENNLRPGDVPATGPGGRLLKEDVLRHLERSGPSAAGGKAAPDAAAPAAAPAAVAASPNASAPVNTATPPATAVVAPTASAPVSASRIASSWCGTMRR